MNQEKFTRIFRDTLSPESKWKLSRCRNLNQGILEGVAFHQDSSVDVILEELVVYFPPTIDAQRIPPQYLKHYVKHFRGKIWNLQEPSM